MQLYLKVLRGSDPLLFAWACSQQNLPSRRITSSQGLRAPRGLIVLINKPGWEWNRRNTGGIMNPPPLLFVTQGLSLSLSDCAACSSCQVQLPACSGEIGGLLLLLSFFFSSLPHLAPCLVYLSWWEHGAQRFSLLILLFDAALPALVEAERLVFRGLHGCAKTRLGSAPLVKLGCFVT